MFFSDVHKLVCVLNHNKVAILFCSIEILCFDFIVILFD